MGEYELTLADKAKKIYVTVYLKKAEAETLIERLSRSLKRGEDER